MAHPAVKGRAAQPVRPGLLIKSVLSGELPLITAGGAKGEEIETFVDNATMTDLHFTYSILVKRVNQGRPIGSKLRGMTTESFAKLFRFAKYMGLFELVETEPMLYPPPSGPLLQIEDKIKVVVSQRKYYKLSSLGEAEGIAWENLCRAWREEWPLGRPAVEIVEAFVEEDIELPAKRKVGRPKSVFTTPKPVKKPKEESIVDYGGILPGEFFDEEEEFIDIEEVAEEQQPIIDKEKTEETVRIYKEKMALLDKNIIIEIKNIGKTAPSLSFSDKPGVAQFKKMITLLKLLIEVGVDNSTVKSAINDKILITIADWQIEAGSAAEKARSEEKIERLESWEKKLEEISVSLENMRLDDAINDLEELVQ